MCFGCSFTQQLCFGRLKSKLLETFRYRYRLCVNYKNICKKGDVICICIIYSGVRTRVVAASYWPGMHNTVFLVVFMDLCERGSFDNKTFQKHKEHFPFLVHCCSENLPLFSAEVADNPKYSLKPTSLLFSIHFSISEISELQRDLCMSSRVSGWLLYTHSASGKSPSLERNTVLFCICKRFLLQSESCSIKTPKQQLTVINGKTSYKWGQIYLHEQVKWIVHPKYDFLTLISFQTCIYLQICTVVNLCRGSDVRVSKPCQNGLVWWTVALNVSSDSVHCRFSS